MLSSPTLFGSQQPGQLQAIRPRARRALILPRFLAHEATKAETFRADAERAFQIIKKWADLERKGRLAKKETSLDAEFLQDVFGEALVGIIHGHIPTRRVSEAIVTPWPRLRVGLV